MAVYIVMTFKISSVTCSLLSLPVSAAVRPYEFGPSTKINYKKSRFFCILIRLKAVNIKKRQICTTAKLVHNEPQLLDDGGRLCLALKA